VSQQSDILGRSVRDFAAATAAKTPTPGGGSVAGAVGMLGTALGEMALAFTRGKKKFAEHEAYYEHLAGRLLHARTMFADLVEDDMAAYSLYQEAQKQPDGPAKEEAVQVAVAAAINVPREAAKLALALLGDLRELEDKVNPWLITDLMASAVLAAAVTRLSDYNVRINVPQVADKAQADEIRQGSAADCARAYQILDEIEQAAREHLS